MAKLYFLLFFALSCAQYFICEEVENATLQHVDDENKKKIDYDYYKDFNLTEQLEKDYNTTYPEDHSEEFYKSIEEVGSNKGKKKEKRETQEEREAREWDEKIHKFSPANLLTVKILKTNFEVFFEHIETVPTLVTVAFYVHDEESKVDFLITSPNKKTIFKLKGKNRGYYEFNATVLGVYEYLIDNERVS